MQTDKDLSNFFDKYGIHDVITERRRQARMPVHYNGGFNRISADDFSYVETYDIDVVNLKLPVDALTKIATVMEEWDRLYKNPETARLIHEARFINRLHNGL